MVMVYLKTDMYPMDAAIIFTLRLPCCGVLVINKLFMEPLFHLKNTFRLSKGISIKEIMLYSVAIVRGHLFPKPYPRLNSVRVPVEISSFLCRWWRQLSPMVTCPHL